MFHSARIKLTSWYLLIIMAISIAFSTFIYIEASHEFTRILRAQRAHVNIRIIQQTPFTDTMMQKTPIYITQQDADQVVNDERTRVLESLIEINIVILLLSAFSGYFLAGRTLKPIQKMVDDQNRFITDASHELNTPLTAIRTTIEVNLRNKDLSLTKAKEVLESNLEEVTNLQTLSDELIKLNQFQEHQQMIPQEKVILATVIQSAITKLTPLAQKKHITITSQVPDATMRGEARSLKELFVILLDNAIKYSPEKKTIRVSAIKKDKKIRIRVKDNGIGMDKQALERIYDRFYRADSSRTKQQTPGYGLGLSIAKQIVTLHQGTISVASTAGKGTTFTIILPEA